MITEDQQAKTQSVCYTVDMKMNQESLYHMDSVEKHLNPSAPLWVWLTFTALLWTCRAGCVISILLRIFGIFHSLTAAIIFLIRRIWSAPGGQGSSAAASLIQTVPTGCSWTLHGSVSLSKMENPLR